MDKDVPDINVGDILELAPVHGGDKKNCPRVQWSRYMIEWQQKTRRASSNRPSQSHNKDGPEVLYQRRTTMQEAQNSKTLASATILTKVWPQRPGKSRRQPGSASAGGYRPPWTASPRLATASADSRIASRTRPGRNCTGRKDGHEPVDLLFHDGWTIVDVEVAVAAMFETGAFEHYERDMDAQEDG